VLIALLVALAGREANPATYNANLLTGFSCRPTEWRDEEADTRVRDLDVPFHFLTDLAGYRVERLSRESGRFSTWGDVTLRRKAGAAPSAAAVRAQMLAAARKRRWKAGHADVLDLLDQNRLARLGVTPADKAVELVQTIARKGKGPPTRYACRAWILEGGNLIVVALRVDAE
jgi:hypothetical protein